MYHLALYPSYQETNATPSIFTPNLLCCPIHICAPHSVISHLITFPLMDKQIAGF